MLFYTLLL